MSLFGTILDKLGIKHPAPQAAPAKPAVVESKPAPQVPPPAMQASPANPFGTPPASTPSQAPAAQPPVPQAPSTKPPVPEVVYEARPVSPAAPAPQPAPVAIPVVDVVSKLEQLAATHPEKLNWKVSIVDLLKLLGIDSSFEARKELATELGCPADMMGDSARMNTWLHKTVLQKIAENGGNIPKELLD